MKGSSEYQPDKLTSNSGSAHASLNLKPSDASLLRHQERVRVRAESRLAPLATSRADLIIKEFRAFLRLEDERLRVADRLGANGSWIARARTFTIDLLVQNAFRNSLNHSRQTNVQKDDGLAIVAIGGYGRIELAPFSDIDLLFLSAGRNDNQTSAVIERCQHLLWDSGLHVSQKSFTAAECLPAIRNDPHFQTALIDARSVAGNDTKYRELITALDRDRVKNQASWLKTIRTERDQLFQKRGAAIYLQEPNVKESAGALRDLHCALWCAYVRYGQRTLLEMLQHRLIEITQYERLAAAHDFLLRVRHQAHWLSGRQTDHLALDLQDAIARKLNYKSSPHRRASEEFMRDYYRHAREIHRFSESILAQDTDTLEGRRKWFGASRREKLNSEFSLKDGRLYFDGDQKLFARTPLLFFKAAALAEAHTADFSSALSDCIRNNLSAVDPPFRKSGAAADAFLNVLSAKGRVGPALRLMHETGLLGRYLPEFDRISMLIQHDLYHQYTVDEHTLRTIEALDQLYRNEETVAASMRAALNEVLDARWLYLALLLHDLGKGRGRGHIPRGARMAERICDRLGLETESRNKVVQLVRHHVLMAQLSQRRDLREARVSKHFAGQLGSLDILNMLYVLTYADLNGVGPGVWSDWKGTLLDELYARTRAVFTGEILSIQNDAQRLKEKVIEELAGTISISEIERHFALAPKRYLEAVDVVEVQLHLTLISEMGASHLALRWADRGDFATKLTICARDRRGLFAEIAGTLAASGIEILSADVNTREDAIAIDTFILKQATTHRAIDHHRWQTIGRSIETAIKGEHDVAALVERWRTRHAPRRSKRLETARAGELSVACDNEAAEATTMVEVRAPDEHGLAYKIARTLTAMSLEIVCAKIATEKSDALDVFYVATAAGTKLDAVAMTEVEASLRQALTSQTAGQASVAGR